MPVRLFLSYFVVLAASATIAFASFEVDGSDRPGSFAAAQRYSTPFDPGLSSPASAFPVHPHKLSKHVQVAQAE